MSALMFSCRVRERALIIECIALCSFLVPVFLSCVCKMGMMVPFSRIFGVRVTVCHG